MLGLKLIHVSKWGHKQESPDNSRRFLQITMIAVIVFSRKLPLFSTDSCQCFLRIIITVLARKKLLFCGNSNVLAKIKRDKIRFFVWKQRWFCLKKYYVILRKWQLFFTAAIIWRKQWELSAENGVCLEKTILFVNKTMPDRSKFNRILLFIRVRWTIIQRWFR